MSVHTLTWLLHWLPLHVIPSKICMGLALLSSSIKMLLKRSVHRNPLLRFLCYLTTALHGTNAT